MILPCGCCDMTFPSWPTRLFFFGSTLEASLKAQAECTGTQIGPRGEHCRHYSAIAIATDYFV